MWRPPCLPSFLIAASCLLFFAEPASAQPAWDLADDGDAESASPSTSASVGTDDETPPDVPRVPRAAAAPAAASSWDTGSGDPLTEEKLAKVEEALKTLQPRCRTYVAGWVGLQLGLTGYFAYDATTREHERAWRTSDIMNATIAGLNSVLQLVKPMPCMSAYRRFKKLPDGTLNERRVKADEGARMIGEQISADRKYRAPQEHIVAALVGIGFGMGIFFGYDEDNIRPAIQTMLGVILLAELQFATRPFATYRYSREIAMMGKGTPPGVTDLSFAPMITRYSQGLSLVGRF